MAKLKRTKLRKKPIDATWQELGMKPGVRVPGTASWMAEWRRYPNQKAMIRYAQEVHKLGETMSEMGVAIYLKKYLTGNWSPSDEAKIAAAIRRSPMWEAKYNQMEEYYMSKKQADAVKKASKKAEGASLKSRIEDLEKEVVAIKASIARILKTSEAKAEVKTKKGEGKKKDVPGPTETKDVKVLLEELDEAKEAGDTHTAAGIRRRLRKAGYSLRSNGK